MNIETPKQRAAKIRNWQIFRLRGALAFVSNLETKSPHKAIAVKALSLLLRDI